MLSSGLISIINEENCKRVALDDDLFSVGLFEKQYLTILNSSTQNLQIFNFDNWRGERIENLYSMWFFSMLDYLKVISIANNNIIY